MEQKEEIFNSEGNAHNQVIKAVCFNNSWVKHDPADNTLSPSVLQDVNIIEIVEDPLPEVGAKGTYYRLGAPFDRRSLYAADNFIILSDRDEADIVKKRKIEDDRQTMQTLGVLTILGITALWAFNKLFAGSSNSKKQDN